MFFTDSSVKVMKEVCVVLTATCIDWFLFCLHFTFLVCIFCINKVYFHKSISLIIPCMLDKGGTQSIILVFVVHRSFKKKYGKKQLKGKNYLVLLCLHDETD